MFSVPSHVLTVSLLFLSAAVARADDRADLQAAAKKVVDADNCAFVILDHGDRRTSGRTQGGYTYFKASYIGNEPEFFVRGQNGVAKVNGTWKSIPEMAPGVNERNIPRDQGDAERTLVNALGEFWEPLDLLKYVSEKLQSIEKKVDGTNVIYSGTIPAEDVSAFFDDRRPTGLNLHRLPGTGKVSVQVTVTNGRVLYLGLACMGNDKLTNGDHNNVNTTKRVTFQSGGQAKLDVPPEVKQRLDAK